MNKICYGAIAVTALLVIGFAHAQTIERHYKLPSHGVLHLAVPEEWVEKVNWKNGKLPPDISYSQNADEKISIAFTPIWNANTGKPFFASAEDLRSMVRGLADKASSRAVETVIEVKKVEGRNTGYYYSLTEKSPKYAEGKFASFGAVEIDEVLVTFIIYTNRSDSKLVQRAIAMFADMTHTK